MKPLSREFLLKQGKCCESDCVNCPYIKCSRCKEIFVCEIEIGKDKCWCMDYEPISISNNNKCMCTACMSIISKLKSKVMNKSKMKEIRRHVRSTDLDNASQMNKVDGRIYERNPDTNQIKSRKKGDYGNERIEKVSTVMREQAKDLQVEAYNENAMEAEMDKVINPLRKRIREEVLDELWAADKLNKDGYWYVKLSDVIKIIGEE